MRIQTSLLLAAVPLAACALHGAQHWELAAVGEASDIAYVDAAGFSGSLAYFLDPLELTSGPYREAEFLERPRTLRVWTEHFRTELDDAWVFNRITARAVGIDSWVRRADSPHAVHLGYEYAWLTQSFPIVEGGTPMDFDSESHRVGLAYRYFLNARFNAGLDSSYARERNDDGSTVDRYNVGLAARMLQPLGANQWLMVRGAITRRILRWHDTIRWEPGVNQDDATLYELGTTFYLSRRTGLGLDWDYDGAAENHRAAVHADHFFSERVAVSLRVSRAFLDEVSDPTDYSARVTLRF